MLPLASNLEGATLLPLQAKGHSCHLEGQILSIEGEKITDLPPDRVRKRLLEGYRAKGADFFTSCLGAYTVVIQQGTTLVAYRSLTSPHQIYYSDKFLSNHLGPLLRQDGLAEIDETYLMLYLMGRQHPSFKSKRTPFQEITRLPAGDALFSTRSKDVQVKTLDVPRFNCVTNKKQNPAALATTFGELFEEVLSDQIEMAKGAPLACELSGGLDSSYVCSLLAESQHPIRAFMFSYPDAPSHRYSESCAREVSKKYENVDFHVYSPEDFFPFDLSEPLPPVDEPSRFLWQGALFNTKVAESLPQGTHLFSGIGSDQLFLRSASVLPWLLKQGDFSEFFSKLGDLSKNLDRGAFSLFYQSLLSLLPMAFSMKWAPVLNKLPFGLFNSEEINPQYHLMDAIAWLNADVVGDTLKKQSQILCEEQALHQEVFQESADLRFPLDSIAIPQHSIVPFLAPKQISYHMPFYDRRVLNFVYGTIAWHWIHDWKHPYKHLLREAQKGVVPEFTRTRSKNEFCFDGYLARLFRENEAFVRSLVLDSRLLPEGIFNRNALRTTLEQLFFGKINNNTQSLIALLFYLVWLRNIRASAESGSPKESLGAQ